MKTEFSKLIILVALLCYSRLCLAQDVRNCTWGMSIDQVKVAEGAEPINVGQEVIGGGSNGKRYSDKVEATFRTQIGLNLVEIVYYFSSNKLTSALMRVYFSQYHDGTDFSVSRRLNEFGSVLRNFSKSNGYITDKYFTTGNYFSAMADQNNRLCFQAESFDYISAERAKQIQGCLMGKLANSGGFYGIGATNLRNNIFISFPPISSKASTFKEIVGWVSCDPKQKVQTRDF